MAAVVASLLLFLFSILGAGALNENVLSVRTACVVATKIPDGTYNFYLESGSSLWWDPSYDFLIPAATWFNQSLNDLGMAIQTVKTSGQFDDKIQAYWAGFLELYISRNMSYAHLENTFGGMFVSRQKIFDIFAMFLDIDILIYCITTRSQAGIKKTPYLSYCY